MAQVRVKRKSHLPRSGAAAKHLGVGTRQGGRRRGEPESLPAAPKPTSKLLLLNSHRLWVSGITSWRLWWRLEMKEVSSLSRLWKGEEGFHLHRQLLASFS